jgi:serine/threonine-protein phosphatase 2A regulatory subunit A
MDYDEQENLTVYIEELKSDDPSLKVNAALKILPIAKILGFIKKVIN